VTVTSRTEPSPRSGALTSDHRRCAIRRLRRDRTATFVIVCSYIVGSSCLVKDPTRAPRRPPSDPVDAESSGIAALELRRADAGTEGADAGVVQTRHNASHDAVSTTVPLFGQSQSARSGSSSQSTTRPFLPEIPLDLARPCCRRPADEPSKYGHFEFTVDSAATDSGAAAECRFVFRHSSGQSTPLFSTTAGDCAYAAHGVDDSDNLLNVGTGTLGAVNRVGQIQLPSINTNGDEFHLLSIASARGGNASYGNDYWAVVIRSGSAWSTATPFVFDRAFAVANGSAGGLVLVDPATTTRAGVACVVTFGLITTTDLPLLPSWVVSKWTRLLVGKNEGSYHLTNWHHAIRIGDSELIVIDDEGTCDLAHATSSSIRLTVEMSQWSDGRRTTRCIKLR
jgi:hypothetical protein